MRSTTLSAHPAYGTLDGHPEAGEEAFVVARESVGTWFTLLAYSRPATWYARLGGPVTRIAQTQARPALAA